jgi:hypothetical protein
MKNSLVIMVIILALLSFTACTQSPTNDDVEMEINVFGLYPGNNDTYTILAAKSYYQPSEFDYIDSLLFIQIDTSGNEVSTTGSYVPYRPNLRQIYLLNNGNIMIYGNMYSYYFNNSVWEYSPAGVLINELELSDRTDGVSPSIDGDLFVFGRVYSDTYYDDLIYSKVTMNGDTLWSKRITDLQNRIYYTSGAPTSDNECVALGRAWLNDRGMDIFVSRISAAGDTLWSGLFGGDQYDDANFAKELTDGSILVIGELNLYDSTNTNWGLNSGQQVYLIKLSANGDKLWTKAIGNTLRERPNAILEASDGSLILLGTRDQSYAYLFDEPIGWVSKLSSAGEEIWSIEFESKLPVGVRELPNGDFLVVTQNLSGKYFQSAADLNIIKLNSSGTLLWDRVLTP